MTTNFCTNCGHTPETHPELGPCSVTSCQCPGFGVQDSSNVTPLPAEPKYPGVFRRLFGFWIDAILVGFLGGLVGSTVQAIPTPMAIMAVIYFTLAVKLFGRTLGQKLLGFSVVDMDGESPTWRRANLRALPLAIILGVQELGNVSPLAGLLSIPFDAGAITIAVFVFVGLPVTVIFHPQRRGIHDLLAGTICVRTAASVRPINLVRMGLRLRVALLAIAVVSLAVGILSGLSGLGELEVNPVFAENQVVVESWLSQGIVEGVEMGYSVKTWKGTSGSGKAVSLVIKANVPGGTLDDQRRVNELHVRLACDLKVPEGTDSVVINLVEESNFGGMWFGFWQSETKYRDFPVREQSIQACT